MIERERPDGRVHTPETHALTEHTRPVPFIASVLEHIDAYFPPGTAHIIVYAASNPRYEHAYNCWEAVRLVRSEELVGSSKLATGDEGQFAGLKWDPERIVTTEAYVAQKMLDTDVRNHRYDHARRAFLDIAMHNGRPTTSQLQNIGILYSFFRQMRQNLAQTCHDSNTRFDTNAFDSFRTQTSMMVKNQPMKLAYDEESRMFTNAYYLPQNPLHRVTPPAPPAGMADGHRLALSLGLAGHPVLRTIEQSGVAMAVVSAPKSYMPPKGSPKRARLEHAALLSLLPKLETIREGTIDAFFSENGAQARPDANQIT